jgi:hypothetical protein
VNAVDIVPAFAYHECVGSNVDPGHETEDETMTTETRTFTVEHEWRPEYQGNDWHVMDGDGDCLDSLATEREARVRAAELRFAAADDAADEQAWEAGVGRDEQAEDLKAEIADLIGDLTGLDLDALRAVRLAALDARRVAGL